MTEACLLTLRNVTLSFGQTALLRGVDLDLRRGEHGLILGPSGSGKTTLLNLIARLLPVDGGQIAFGGEDFGKLGSPQAWRLRHIGQVFQEIHLLEALTVFENIEMVQLEAGIPDPIPVEDLLTPLGLGERMHESVRHLSRGERQRVALARAFANRPGLVLADEPTASLDASTREASLDHLFGLCDRVGSTALVVSHDLSLRQRSEFARQWRLGEGRLSECRDTVGG